jgi:UDP-GlcNAc:undecaprenyl-phosphate GlcNAc-1-phosphate transferase
MLFSWCFQNDLVVCIAKLGLYILTPFVVYSGDQGIYEYFGEEPAFIYNLLFAVLLVFLLLTLHFTRRKTRFKSTPSDFLLLFMVFLFSILPISAIKNHQLSLVAVKTIIFYFGFEILLGELKNRYNKITLVSMFLILLIGLKGFISLRFFP